MSDLHGPEARFTLAVFAFASGISWQGLYIDGWNVVYFAGAVFSTIVTIIRIIGPLDDHLPS